MKSQIKVCSSHFIKIIFEYKYRVKRSSLEVCFGPEKEQLMENLGKASPFPVRIRSFASRRKNFFSSLRRSSFFFHFLFVYLIRPAFLVRAVDEPGPTVARGFIPQHTRNLQFPNPFIRRLATDWINGFSVRFSEGKHRAPVHRNNSTYVCVCVHNLGDFTLFSKDLSTSQPIKKLIKSAEDENVSIDSRRSLPPQTTFRTGNIRPSAINSGRWQTEANASKDRSVFTWGPIVVDATVAESPFAFRPYLMLPDPYLTFLSENQKFYIKERRL